MGFAVCAQSHRTAPHRRQSACAVIYKRLVLIIEAWERWKGKGGSIENFIHLRSRNQHQSSVFNGTKSEEKRKKCIRRMTCESAIYTVRWWQPPRYQCVHCTLKEEMKMLIDCDDKMIADDNTDRSMCAQRSRSISMAHTHTRQTQRTLKQSKHITIDSVARHFLHQQNHLHNSSINSIHKYFKWNRCLFFPKIQWENVERWQRRRTISYTPIMRWWAFDVYCIREYYLTVANGET